MEPDPTDERLRLALRQLANPFLLGGGLIVAALFGGIGWIISPGAAVLGVLVAFGIVVATAWSIAGDAQEADALRAWGAARAMTYGQRAAIPGSTRLLRASSCRMGPGVAGELAGDRGGVAFAAFTEEVGDRSHTFDATIAWTTVPALPGVARVHVSNALTGRGLANLLGPERTVHLESAELGERFTVEVDDAADDLVVRRLFEPSLITWVLDQHEPELWAQGEGRLLTVVRVGRFGDDASLAVLVRRLERLAEAWRHAAETPAAAGS